MEADLFNQAGREALERDDLEGAAREFLRACKAAPGWSVPYYNLGLVRKLQRLWRESLEAHRTAFRLEPGDEATVWNMAIAAAALGEWESARHAFRAMGLEVPPGSGPWDFRLGLIPIRVDPDHRPEVLWCHRLDPVRARIANVPLPGCGRRYGDVLLNDGEPRGYRELEGQEVPVFNELEVLEPSGLHTYELRLRVASAGAVGDLVALLAEHDLVAEDWSRTVRLLCRACSEGRPHEQHDHDLPAAPEGEHRLGVAAPDDTRLRELVIGWPRAEVLGLERVV